MVAAPVPEVEVPDAPEDEEPALLVLMEDELPPAGYASERMLSRLFNEPLEEPPGELLVAAAGLSNEVTRLS